MVALFGLWNLYKVEPRWRNYITREVNLRAYLLTPLPLHFFFFGFLCAVENVTSQLPGPAACCHALPTINGPHLPGNISQNKLFPFFRFWLLAVAFHHSSTEVLGAGISRCISLLFALALTIHPYLLSSTEAEVFVALTSRTMQVCALVLEED